MNNFCKLLILIFLFQFGNICLQVNAQSKKSQKLFEKALSHYKAEEINEAEELLTQILSKEPNFVEAQLFMSELCYEKEDYLKQIHYLENVIKIDSNKFIQVYFNLGRANFRIKDYNVAKNYFLKYNEKAKTTSQKLKVQDWITRTCFAIQAVENKFNIEPQNVGANINSKYNEYWPSITADGETLIFTVLVSRDSTAENTKGRMADLFHEDFYVSEKNKNGEWQVRKQLSKPLNTNSNEGAQTLSADGNWMFFTACGREGGKGTCDIYFSKRTLGGWSEPKNIGMPINTPYWESQPSFSSDGKTLYFVSNRPEGLGGNDIWRAKLLGEKSDGTPYFSAPENLGDKINTNKNEISPFIHPDNTTLYFASEGWVGMGQSDLFMARMKDGKFTTEAINLGVPINTENDEIGLIVTADGSKAFFSSDKMGESFGGKDIYSFDMPAEIRPTPVSYIKGRVFDAYTKKQLEAAFELKNIENGETTMQTKSTGFSGEFLLCLPANGSYALSASKPGYLFHSEHFTIDGASSYSEPQLIDIYLKPIKLGEQVVLNNIFFETDSYKLLDNSKVELEKLYSFMNENAEVKIQILGHTDNVGTDEYNNKLSMQRAQQVQQYLVGKGISTERVTFKGEGAKKPIADNNTETGRAKNRRTEMKIVSND